MDSAIRTTASLYGGCSPELLSLADALSSHRLRFSVYRTLEDLPARFSTSPISPKSEQYALLSSSSDPWQSQPSTKVSHQG